MQPRPPRRVAGGELVAREVLHIHVEGHRSARQFGPAHRQRGRVLLQLPHRGRRRGRQLRRQGLDAELGAVTAEQPQHERVAADKRVLRQAVAIVTKHRRNAHGSRRARHVARLATGLFGVERAVLPFLVVHLLGQAANHLAVWTKCFRDQRMARRAQLRLLDVRRLDLLVAGHRLHDAPPAGINRVWPLHLANALRVGAGHDEAAVEAFGHAELVFRNLMAHGARHAIARQLALVRQVQVRERQTREHFAGVAGRLRHALVHRHVARGALVLNGRGLRRVIDRLATNARLPIRIPRRIGHHRRSPGGADRDVGAIGGDDLVVAGDAVGGMRELRHRRVAGRGGDSRGRLRARQRQHHHEHPQRHGCGQHQRVFRSKVHRHHFQNEKRPPSNQSQRK